VPHLVKQDVQWRYPRNCSLPSLLDNILESWDTRPETLKPKTVPDLWFRMLAEIDRAVMRELAM
jgi:hypothetical protein